MIRLIIVIGLLLPSSGCVMFRGAEPAELDGEEEIRLTQPRTAAARGFQFRYRYDHDAHIHDDVVASDVDSAVQRALKGTELVGRGAEFGTLLRATFTNAERPTPVLNWVCGFTLLIIPGYTSNDLNLSLELIWEGEVVAKVEEQAGYGTFAQLALLLALPFNNYDVEADLAELMATRAALKLIELCETRGLIESQ